MQSLERKNVEKSVIGKDSSEVMVLGVGKKKYKNGCQKREVPKEQGEPRHAHFWLRIPSP